MNQQPQTNQNHRTGVIAIVGRPNVGKSTLLNHLIGEKLAAVTPKAQTTRKRFRGIRSEPDTQMIFLDTPGVHVPPKGKALNQFLVHEALSGIEDADLVIYLLDGTREFRGMDPKSDEGFLLNSLKAKLEKHTIPLIVTLNKSDLFGKEGKFTDQKSLRDILELLPVTAFLPLSAKTGRGVEELLDLIRKNLPEGPALFPEDELTDQSLRSIAGELIQEQLFFQLGEELPYSCAVEIVRYEDPKEGKRLPEIEARIHVERDSQKAMVIGKGGQKLKEIGIRARQSIERVVDGKVVLRLFVTVTPDWTRQRSRLEQLGYTLPREVES